MSPGEKHNELALLALTWLRNKVTRKGMRAATEVALAPGYVTDAAALCSLQLRFLNAYLQHSELKAESWDYFACVFEAKATKADFLNTFGSGLNHQNRHEPIGSLHWCITPRNMVNTADLPQFWGLLEVYGAGLREVKKPQINILTESAFDAFAHRLIWPLQARRNYISCKKCETLISTGYCGRCFIRSPRGERSLK